MEAIRHLGTIAASASRERKGACRRCSKLFPCKLGSFSPATICMAFRFIHCSHSFNFILLNSHPHTSTRFNSQDSLPPRRPLRPPQHLNLLLHSLPPKRLHPAAGAAAAPVDPALVVPVNDGIIGYDFVGGDGAEGADFTVLKSLMNPSISFFSMLCLLTCIFLLDGMGWDGGKEGKEGGEEGKRERGKRGREVPCPPRLPVQSSHPHTLRCLFLSLKLG